MKKLLAVLLAAMLVLSMGVMAFATDYTADTDAAASQLATKLTDEDGNPVAGFTVTIPAEVPIPWGGTEAGDFINWSYSSKLETGNQLSIAVIEGASGNMTTADGSATLAYALDAAADAVSAPFLTGEEVTDGTQNKQIEILIADDAWAAASVAQYTATVTFEVAQVAL
ncbi:MAG TPA: hypothetical protein IAC53_01675 [Candidatus Fimenecus excrementigallinarum]|uniref:Uncharacterized protein n=1 Tax=Candidatus Fimenecus excrementigallinarum TaxID=2840816 RepID=A0A9D1IDP6_9FIRM|nr:hypothetical protein [Candidatus Fimenecus excrementigallinarum]